MNKKIFLFFVFNIKIIPNKIEFLTLIMQMQHFILTQKIKLIYFMATEFYLETRSILKNFFL